MAALRRHEAKLRRHAAYKAHMMSRRKQTAALKAKRAAIAKAAGLTKGTKKAKAPCAKKPKMIAESINMIVMRPGVAN
jgi:hypothetical protein